MFIKFLIIISILNIVAEFIIKVNNFTYNKEKEYRKELDEKIEYFTNIFNKDIFNYIFIGCKILYIISLIVVLTIVIMYYNNLR